MRVEISDATFSRLQSIAKPLVETVDDVINKLIDFYDQKGRTKSDTSNPRTTAIRQTREHLMGFQRELWELLIQPMPTTRFTLRDVYARKEVLAKLRPHVQELEASIRNALEKLRDKGYIQFVDNQGTYLRLA